MKYEHINLQLPSSIPNRKDSTTILVDVIMKEDDRRELITKLVISSFTHCITLVLCSSAFSLVKRWKMWKQIWCFFAFAPYTDAYRIFWLDRWNIGVESGGTGIASIYLFTPFHDRFCYSFWHLLPNGSYLSGLLAIQQCPPVWTSLPTNIFVCNIWCIFIKFYFPHDT